MPTLEKAPSHKRISIEGTPQPPRREGIIYTGKPIIEKLGDLKVKTSKQDSEIKKMKVTDAAGWRTCPESEGFCD